MILWLFLIPVLLAGVLYYCYRQVFWVDRKKTLEPRQLLSGEQYEVRREALRAIINSAMEIPYEEVYVTDPGGLTLYARYYEAVPGAPLQIMFHGYRSNAVRDFSGGMQLALKEGCNVLLVDQRAHGKSGGRCLSFGILERRDCLTWIGYARERFGDVPMYLVGISMGAATVLMASELELPENIKGIISDCGYSSPRAIIQKVMAERHYPVKLVYPFVRLSGILFGGFDIDSAAAVTALRRCRVPVLFIHGEDDRFVPCEMTWENYTACAGEKYILTVPGAAHGLSYVVDHKGYSGAVRDFLRRTLG